MRTWIKVLSALAVLMLATTLRAESEPLSLGYVESGSIEIDMLGSTYGSVSLYQDGELVFTLDDGGVTYAAPGVSWYPSGPYIIVTNLPTGDYTGTLTVSGAGAGDYSYQQGTSPTISFNGTYSWYYATFIVY